MLIKSTDDRSRRIALLQDLQESSTLDVEQKTWLRDQLFQLKQGIAGERDAAHYLDSYLRDSATHAVIHDLRLEVDGQVAQIDHLVIARGFIFYLLETKNFGGNLTVNERGEFSVQYAGGKAFGIPSPVEQSRRHEPVLVKLLERLEIAGRVGKRPEFQHVVLVHPRATISRPDAKRLDTGNVIKADQFAAWHQEFAEKDMSVAQVFGALLNLRSSTTVREWAEKVARQHRPADLLALPEFMKPRYATVSSEGLQKNQQTQKAQTPEPRQEPNAKLTSSKVAQKMGLATQELLSKLVTMGCQEFKDGRHYLTDQGKAAGGEFRTGKHGPYFLWPDSLVLR